MAIFQTGISQQLYFNRVVDTVFLTCVKEGDFGEGKVANSKETKRCTELGSADGSSSDGPREYFVKILISPLWYSADGELPM